MTGRERLLRCYPPGWRQRYGDDLAAYLDDSYGDALPLRAVASLVAGGVRERVRSARATQAALPAAARTRSGVLLVLVGWAAFVVAGSGFAKVSEHFDASLSPGGRTVPDVAYALVQGVALVTGLLVLVGIALAAPAFVRLMSSGGWSGIRRPVARAAVATALSAGTTVALVAWAHELSPGQRNGGDATYATAFLVWGGLVVLTIALWTAAAVAAGRTLALSRRVLLTEAALATAVTAGMLAMLVATAVWWVATASSAPVFFGRTSSAAAVWTPQLLGTVALMVAAVAAGAVGVARIARSARAA